MGTMNALKKQNCFIEIASDNFRACITTEISYLSGIRTRTFNTAFVYEPE
jgi:hypothetical protein